MTQDHRTPDTGPVPHDLFRAERFPERDRFDIWRQSVMPLFDSIPEQGMPKSAPWTPVPRRQPICPW